MGYQYGPNVRGYNHCNYGSGCGRGNNGFALIVVLFILLIIVGATFCYK